MSGGLRFSCKPCYPHLKWRDWIAIWKLMRKSDRATPNHNLWKCRANRTVGLAPRLIIGLVIFTATSVSNLNGARAETSSAQGVTMAAATDGQKIPESARTTAASLFGDRCAVCHGPNGDGKGPGAANLNPKPQDFRNRKWQRSVTDEKITKAIVYGGPAVGLSSSMAANPDLEAQPSVVAALVEHIRSLAHKR
jgi:mono/diheme cytochrome c family protein